MKKRLVIVGIVVLLISVGGLSGCILSGANADIKIVSVDINDFEQIKTYPYTNLGDVPYITYNITINLKNIGNEGTKARIDLEVQYWNEDTDEWRSSSVINDNSETVYIEAGSTMTKTMSVYNWKILPNESDKIKIDVYKFKNEGWYITDSYEKLV